MLKNRILVQVANRVNTSSDLLLTAVEITGRFQETKNIGGLVILAAYFSCFLIIRKSSVGNENCLLRGFSRQLGLLLKFLDTRVHLLGSKTSFSYRFRQGPVIIYFIFSFSKPQTSSMSVILVTIHRVKINGEFSP